MKQFQIVDTGNLHVYDSFIILKRYQGTETIMPDYLKKTWYPSAEELQLLDEIAKEIAAGSAAAALRYCVRQEHKRLFKTKKKP